MSIDCVWHSADAFGLNLGGVAVNTLPAEALSKQQYNGGSTLEDDLLGVEAGNYATPYRQYDATLGRFLGVDALAELYTDRSPFVFVGNDPVNLQDPSGAFDKDGFGNISLKGGRGHDSFGFAYSNPHLDPTSSYIGMGVGPTAEYGPWVKREAWNGPSALEYEMWKLGRSVGLQTHYDTNQGGVTAPLWEFLINLDNKGHYNNSVSFKLGEFKVVKGIYETEAAKVVASNEMGYGTAPLAKVEQALEALQKSRGTYLASPEARVGERLLKTGSISLNTIGGTINISAKAVNLARVGLKVGGTALGVAGVLLTLDRLANDPTYHFKGEGGLDLVFGLAGFIPVYGWAISGGYAAGKAIYEANKKQP